MQDDVKTSVHTLDPEDKEPVSELALGQKSVPAPPIYVVLLLVRTVMSAIMRQMVHEEVDRIHTSKVKEAMSKALEKALESANKGSNTASS